MIASKEVIHKKESLLFSLSITLSIITILILFFTIIGIPILFGIAFITLISHAISMAFIRLNGVELSSKQFSELYNQVMELGKKMDLKEIPEVYIIESGGLLNAFATRIFGLFGKNIVVLYSDIVELIENGEKDALEFIIAHELSHIKRNHLVKRILIFPVMWVPFLGEAYSRACEFTSDRMAISYTHKPEAAIHALTVLATGTRLYKYVNKDEYLVQYNQKRGFFVTLAELLSTHPAIPRRIFEMEEFVGEKTVSLEKKSKVSVFIILTIAVFSFILVGWTAYTAVKDIAEYFTEGLFYPFETTELIEATINGDTEEMKGLLDEGADPNEQEEEYGSTALTTATDYDQIEAATLLLEYGADPNLADFSGYTPLMGAVFMENTEMIELLINAGADPNLENEEGMSAISQAEEYGYDEMAQFMKEFK